MSREIFAGRIEMDSGSSSDSMLDTDWYIAKSFWWRSAHISAKSLSNDHQMEHFFSGFIFDPTGQLNALANSWEFDISPMTLQKAKGELVNLYS